MSDFFGQPVGVLQNQLLRLEYLLSGGPRLVRLFYRHHPENVLVEVPDIAIPTPVGDYHLWGGHRLWHAPEVMPATYAPDDAGLEVVPLSDGVRLIGAIEPQTGIRKQLEVHLDADQPIVKLRHTLKNCSTAPVELAPWSLTMLPLGGEAHLPFSAPQTAPLLPNRSVIYWPYTQLNDPRLRWEADALCLVARPSETPLKLGWFNHLGWITYTRAGISFTKRFTPQPDLPHLDNGCNAEIYAYNRFIELETLGPRIELLPDQDVEHLETWELTDA